MTFDRVVPDSGAHYLHRSSWRVRSLGALVSVSVAVAAIMLTEAPAAAGRRTTSAPAPALTERVGTFESGTFAEFDQNQSNGEGSSHTVSTAVAKTGGRSMQATIGGGNEGAFSRVLFEGSWAEGKQVVYRAAFYLPAGFFSSQQGQTDLMRFDNWSTTPTQTHRTGVTIQSDHRLYLVRQKLGVEQVTLLGPFSLTDGRWHVIEVRQTLSATSGAAVNELFLNGTRLGSSTKANMYGSPFTRIRYGIVATSPAQTLPLTVHVDDISLKS